MSKTVYVVNKDGKPLMPTNRNRHVRVLLQSKRARVFSRDPFTIQLLYESPSKVQDLYLGIDPGRTNIGATVTRETGESIFTSKLATNNKDIKDHMDTKRMYRRLKRSYSRQKRQRRAIQSGTIFKGTIENTTESTTENTVSTKSKKAAPSKERYLPHYKAPVTVKYIKNKEAKFCNRKKTIYSIPTFKHLIETHINFIEKILRILPVSHIIIEHNKFDFQKLDRTHSTIKGYKSKEDYISHIQGGTCLLCKESPIEHYHHIKFRSNRGSNSHYNLAGLCSSCHSKVHKNAALNHKLQQLKPGYTTKFSGASVLNSCLPSIIERLAEFNIPVYTTTGEITSKFREEHNLPKDHHHDAYCIACSLLTDQKVFENSSVPYLYIQYRRHNRAIKFKQKLDRKYYYKGKLVATNRHKSSIQMGSSLEEYMDTLKSEGKTPIEIEKIISKLRVEHPFPVYYKHREYKKGSILKRKDTKRKEYPETYVLDTTRKNLNCISKDLQSTEFAVSRVHYLRHNSGIVLVN